MKMKKIISMISAAVIAASMTAVTAVPASAAEYTAWQKSYGSFLKKELKNENALDEGFSLFDFDKNGIPELALVKDGKMELYTFRNNKLEKITKFESKRDISYNPSTGVIKVGDDTSYQTEGNLTYYRYKNGKLSKVLEASFKKNSKNVRVYKVNGKTMSESKYNALIKQKKLTADYGLGGDFYIEESAFSLLI